MNRMLLLVAQLVVSAACCLPAPAPAQGTTMRVKDLGKVQGWRDNVLVGTGIVTGLAGTGDSSGNRVSRQALSNVLSQFNLTVAPDQVNSRNVAVVMVSASLPAFAREGDTLDVTVASSGDARSLVGGNLLLAALRAPNGRVYALAQGALAVGGHRYDANGNVVQKNHPTTASIPNGATVEVAMPVPATDTRTHITFVLSEPDYTTASRVAAAINAQLGAGLARARDATGIEVELPVAERSEPVAFLAKLESVRVEPDRRARVVINERTGTVVSGGDVRIARVAISHGDLKININSVNSVSQPSFVGRAGPGVSTAVTNTQIDVEEPTGVGFLAGAGTVSDLVQSLARLKTSTRDIISILRAVKAAGALHGELVVQ